jgi:hypothetical protein
MYSWYGLPSFGGTALPFGGNAPVHLTGDPAAINFGPTTAQVESVFVTGADGNLYCWHSDPTNGPITSLNGWYRQGPATLQLPPVSMIGSNPAPINYGPDSWSTQRENVFVSGIDHLLYADHYDPTAGPAWYWQSFGNGGLVGNSAAPATSAASRTPAAVPTTGTGPAGSANSGGAAHASPSAAATTSRGAQSVSPTPASLGALFSRRGHHDAWSDSLHWLADGND